MDKINSKEVQNSLDTNCSNRADEINRIYEATYPEQRNSKLLCKVSPVCDLVEQSRENSLKLLSLKHERKRKEDIEKGIMFKLKCFFFKQLQIVIFLLTCCCKLSMKIYNKFLFKFSCVSSSKLKTLINWYYKKL